MNPARLPEVVVCPVRAAALTDPYGGAISSPEGEITFRELDDMVSATVRNIRGAGLSGGRVAMYLEKSATQIALIFAVIRSGSVAVPLSTRIPAAEIPEMLLRAGCNALVTDDPAAIRAAAKCEVLTFNLADIHPGKAAREAGEAPTIPSSRPATVVFTSGSTGRPKAALHTFGNHYASAVGSAGNIPLGADDVWLHSLPLFHVGGLSILFRCAVARATIALPGRGETVGEAIRRSGTTHVSLVATQLRRLLDEDADLCGVKAILLGASGIPASLLDRAHGLGLPAHTSYGLTEMSSQVTTTRPGAARDELRTSGGVLPHRELRISEEGEVLVRGDTLFCGYIDVDEDDGLVKPFDADGWFHTKDLGSLDTDGLLSVVGRLDNLFISGGENVQPEEVEEELRRLDGVEDAVVVPVPDDEFGERPVAFVKADGGGVPDDLGERMRPRLPGFKVPVGFYGWPGDAPRGMKVDRGFFRGRAESLRRP